MSLQLIVVAGVLETAARSIPLAEGRLLTLGRSLGCDIPVSDLSVARRQCDIEIREGAAWILDYGFTRGECFGKRVSVNGHPVSSGENYWPQEPREPPEGPTQDYCDRVNQFMQQQYETLTWHRLQSGDEIRIGTAVFRLATSAGTDDGSAEPNAAPDGGGVSAF